MWFLFGFERETQGRFTVCIGIQYRAFKSTEFNINDKRLIQISMNEH